MFLRPRDSKTANLQPPPRRLPDAGLEGHALFLDFDGTLVDIADGPDLIEVREGVAGLLDDLHDRTDGAVAIVSGRSVGALKRYLPRFRGALVGGHGAEMVLGGETVAHPMSNSDTVERIGKQCSRFAEDRQGVSAELKPTGAVLHYRLAPDAEGDAHDVAHRIARDFPEFEVHAAKMAFELRPKDVGKDIAVEKLMADEVFAGRKPVFIGDDATDEPALEWAGARDGVAIHVGNGPSVARFRLSTPSEVHQLLSDWLSKEI